jgi:transcriptional antiterminator Rof (Rho-off)
MSDEAQTKPTIETVLERINVLSVELRGFRMAVESRFDAVEHQLENMDMRLDRIESFAHQTRSEVLALRADFKEFKSQFKQPAA